MDCTHAWEPTGITLATYGARSFETQDCLYCPLCRQFARQSTLFLDGDFRTQAAADKANYDAREQYSTAKTAWLAEHYPEHQAVR